MKTKADWTLGLFSCCKERWETDVLMSNIGGLIALKQLQQPQLTLHVHNPGDGGGGGGRAGGNDEGARELLDVMSGTLKLASSYLAIS